jgi:hypothetical protein
MTPTERTMDRKELRTYMLWMIRAHLPQVLDIEFESFEDPWLEADFIAALRQRNAIGMVAMTGNDVVAGFMVYELHKNDGGQAQEQAVSRAAITHPA